MYKKKKKNDKKLDGKIKIKDPLTQNKTTEIACYWHVTKINNK